MLVHGKLPTITSPAKFPIFGGGLLIGDKFDFNWDWYPSVGAGVLAAMFWNTFVPHISLLFHHQVAQPLHRWFILGFMRETVVTQAQMDDLFTRPTICLETRAAVAFNTVYCGLLFSGGMPITIPLAAVSLWLQRLADKYALVRIVKQPNAVLNGPFVMQHLSGLLPPALILHLAMSVWMFSNEEIKHHNGDPMWDDAPDVLVMGLNATDAATLMVFARMCNLQSQMLAYDLGEQTRRMQAEAVCKRFMEVVGGDKLQSASIPSLLRQLKGGVGDTEFKAMAEDQMAQRMKQMADANGVSVEEVKARQEIQQAAMMTQQLRFAEMRKQHFQNGGGEGGDRRVGGAGGADTMRTPQSAQSVPSGHMLNSAPGPPSSHMPSV